MQPQETLSKSKQKFLLKLLRMERFDFTGMFSSRLFRKKHAEALVDSGLATKQALVVCDGDGFTKEPERWRMGYVLTELGRSLAIDIEKKSIEDWQNSQRDQVQDINKCGSNISKKIFV